MALSHRNNNKNNNNRLWPGRQWEWYMWDLHTFNLTSLTCQVTAIGSLEFPGGTKNTQKFQKSAWLPWHLYFCRARIIILSYSQSSSRFSFMFCRQSNLNISPTQPPTQVDPGETENGVVRKISHGRAIACYWAPGRAGCRTNEAVTADTRFQGPTCAPSQFEIFVQNFTSFTRSLNI